jgi:hypothetical protein
MEIPHDAFERINQRYIEIVMHWKLLRSPAMVKVVLLQGAEVDAEVVGFRVTGFHICMNGGYLDLAEIRNLIAADCPSDRGRSRCI